METLEERFPFLFNKQADYNTNSPSYYDQLAKYNKVLHILAKMIDEYDEKLDNSLDNINTVLTNYTAMLDGKLAGFDDSVMLLLREWIDDGTFEMIINTEIFNHKLDTATFNIYKESVEKRIESEISIENYSIPVGNDITAILNDIIENTSYTTILIPSGDYYTSSLKWFGRAIKFKGAARPHYSGVDYANAARLHVSGSTGLIYSDNNDNSNYGITFEDLVLVCTDVGGVIEFNPSVEKIITTLTLTRFNNCFFVGNDSNTKGFIKANGLMQAMFFDCTFIAPGGWSIDICGDINNFFHCRFLRTKRIVKTRRIGTFGSQNVFRDCDFEVRRAGTEDKYIMEIGDFFTIFDNCYHEVAPSVNDDGTPLTPTLPSTSHPTYNKIKGWYDFSRAFECGMDQCRFDLRANFIVEQLFKFDKSSRVHFRRLKDAYGETSQTNLINPSFGSTDMGEYIEWDYDLTNGKIATFSDCSMIFMRYINQFNKLLEIKDGYYPPSTSISYAMDANDKQFLTSRKKVFNYETRFYPNEVANNGLSFVNSAMKYPVSLKRQKDTTTLQADVIVIYDILPKNEMYFTISVGCEGFVNDTMKVLVRTKDANGNTVETLLNNLPSKFSYATKETKYLFKITNPAFSYIYYQIDVINDSGQTSGWAFNYVEVEPQRGVLLSSDYANYNASLVSPKCHVIA